MVQPARARGPLGWVAAVSLPVLVIVLGSYAGARFGLRTERAGSLVGQQRVSASPPAKPQIETPSGAFVPGAPTFVLPDPGDPALIPEYRADLTSPDADTRRYAVKAIGECGPEALSALDDLIRLLDDPEWPVREVAAWALGEIGRKPPAEPQPQAGPDTAASADDAAD